MTARAGTETAAANNALGHIGQPASIADLATDTSAAARACRQYFGSARDEALRLKDWNFAAAWATPAAIAGAAEGPLKTRYVLPADCIKVRSVDGLAADAWAVETTKVDGADQTVLVTNAEAPLVSYTRRVENVALWDPLMLAGFELLLAAKLAPKIARDPSLAGGLEARARDLIDSGAEIDAREAAPKTVSRDTSWIAARRGGR